MDRAKVTTTVTAAVMVLFFAAALVWLVAEHAAFLHQQTATVQAQNQAIVTLGQLMRELDENYQQAADERESITANQKKIMAQNDYNTGMLRKLLAERGVPDE